MESSVRNAIARIDIVDGGKNISRGTGCLVTDRLVLTALHVVANRFENPPQPYPGNITLTFPGLKVEATLYETYHDPQGDWALLKCEESVSIRPLPLADLRESGGEFVTYGFPDSQPVDGMIQTGTVENHLGELNGVHAFQLFSKQAAAGAGAPVKGLSGAPMLVDDAVVGVLRFALMKDGAAVAGTLYACPIIGIAERCSEFLPMPDPCWGLPGLPRRQLPAKPFHYLHYFKEEEAELFFGRNREIKSFYDDITNEDAAPVNLLYGQSGVGKSSFLSAGLLPRLRRNYEILYIRRDEKESLLRTIQKAILHLRDSHASAGAEEHQTIGNPLRVEWRRAEVAIGKPLILLIDQVEEVFTRPNSVCPDELAEFVQALKEIFSVDNQKLKGRVVVSFRKEWYPEIQKAFESQDVGFDKVFLEALDREAVIEIVTGLVSSARLQKRYGLRIDPTVPNLIATDLRSDQGSPTAPALQILLTKMWEEATDRSTSAPAFTEDLYRIIKEQGLLLDDFINRQLKQLAISCPSHVTSGLALDILVHHTTPLMTATECTSEELVATYRNHEHTLGNLLQECKNLYLLVDPEKDQRSLAKVTRLAHDTLAAPIRHKFDESDLPGPRARRILKNRAVEWLDDDQGAILDDQDLSIVEAGASGLGVLMPHEVRLLAASKLERTRRNRIRQGVRWAMMLAVVGLISTTVLAGLAWYQGKIERTNAENALEKAQRQTELAKIAERDAETAKINAESERKNADLRAMEISLRLEEIPKIHELFSINFHAAGYLDTLRLIEKSHDDLRYVPADLQEILHGLVEMAHELHRIPDQTAQFLSFSPDGALLCVDDLGTAIKLKRDGTIVNTITGRRSLDGQKALVAYTPDGRRIVVVDTRVSLWNAEKILILWSQSPGNRAEVSSVSVGPDGNQMIIDFADDSRRLEDLPEIAGLPFAGKPRVVWRHGDASKAPSLVRYLAVSADGSEIIISFGEDKFLQWDRMAEKLSADGIDRYLKFRSEKLENLPASSVAVSRDGQTIAVGFQDGRIEFWNSEGEKLPSLDKLIPNFVYQAEAVIQMVFCPDPELPLVAALSDDGTVYVFDCGVLGDSNLEGEEVMQKISMTGVWITTVAMGQEGMIVTGGHDGTVRGWLFGMEESTLLQRHKKSVQAIACHPTRFEFVSAGEGKDLKFYNAAGHRLSSDYISPFPVTSLAYNPQGSRIAVGTTQDTVILDPDRTSIVSRVTGDKMLAIEKVAYSPDGESFYSRGDGIMIQMWEADTPDLIWEKTLDEAKAVSVYRDYRKRRSAWIRRGRVGDSFLTIDTPDGKKAVGIDGQSFFGITEREMVRKFDARTNLRVWEKPWEEVKGIPDSHGLDWASSNTVTESPDGDKIFGWERGRVSGNNRRKGPLRLFDKSGNDPISMALRKISSRFEISSTFSPDGRFLVIANGDYDLFHVRADWRLWLETFCRRYDETPIFDRDIDHQFVRNLCDRCLWDDKKSTETEMENESEKPGE